MNTAARSKLLAVLKARFVGNSRRHPDIAWADVGQRLHAAAGKLRSLADMEQSGGEPDVTGRQGEAFEFTDCAPESPMGRRSLCYDGAALAARKENKPRGAALDTAATMGVEMLTEDQYRALQTLGEFDQKTSSWLATPLDIRTRGGALFGDRRFGRVFTYHNGAESYYAARGFRARLIV